MTTVIGRQAEDAAADYLKRHGCKIISQNWRNVRCEIDIVAQRNKTIYFCEVKYRANLDQGSGLEYITPKKLNQMRFAAETWVYENDWKADYQLCAIEVSGALFKITAVIKNFSL